MDGVCPFAAQVAGVTTQNPGYVDRVGFCDHTAGGFYNTLLSAGFWNGQGVSAHFAIARDGRIAQMVNIFDTAWAQGRDQRGMSVGPDSPGITWPPFATMGKGNPNGYLISFEHEDAETVNGRTVFVADATWTQAQYEADLKVKRWCVEEVKRVTGKDLMRFGIDSLAGHHMFDPISRAQCPGPAWRNEYRQRLFNDLSAGGDELSQEQKQELGNARATKYLLDWILRDVDVVPIAEEKRPGSALGDLLTVEFRAPDGSVHGKATMWMRPEVRRGRP